MGSLVGPRIDSVLYPRLGSQRASPKAISERTRYSQVCLDFHSYPQLIAPFCITGAFGPPRPFTAASPWPWIDHLASRLNCATCALITLGFPAAPCLRHLTFGDTA